MNEQLAVNAIRILSADAVQNANSGHPGLPLGAAPIAYELWAHHMKHNPANPQWRNRDRFILSAGHGSSLLYSLLHLFGYGNLGIEDLKNFRQLDSRTPGHPEYGHTVGVEATTGPLGAGLGMAVGMAMAEKHLAAKFNRKNYPVFDHYTYVLCGDGCLMEGISSEVMSLAGTWSLDKLIILYDSNSITIEGSTDLAFTEDVEKRFEAFGFQVLSVEDGNDLASIKRAISAAKKEKKKPSFIKISTEIGYGVPAKEGKSSAHGEPLGEENVHALRETLEWPLEEPFAVPAEISSYYKALADVGAGEETAWNRMYEQYGKAYPKLKENLEGYYQNVSIEKLLDDEAYWKCTDIADATRNSSGNTLNYMKEILPNLIGGSADLGPSNKTVMGGEKAFSKECPEGRNLHYGVREMGMTAVANGIILHKGLKTYVATFFVFADYMKPMLRLSSLMGLPIISVLTHDSIGVGEDGPTHEPVEQLAMLRSLPNMHVFRPADEMETKAAWYAALTTERTPTCIILSRQVLSVLENSSKEALKGGYILKREKKDLPDIIIMATGSEVSVALGAAKILEQEEISVRVVSMPCLDLFEEQEESYKESVLPGTVAKRAVIEAGSSVSWGRYVGIDGCYITMDGFGASAPALQLFEKYGFTIQQAADRLKKSFCKK